jgi:hypothetical protein
MTTLHNVGVQIPRILGLALAVFLAVFALDSFTGSAPIATEIAAGVIHLIPAAIALALVAIGWRWPLAGGVGFLAAAALYAFSVPHGRLDWIAAISGPLTIVGLAFIWTALKRPTQHA